MTIPRLAHFKADMDMVEFIEGARTGEGEIPFSPSDAEQMNSLDEYLQANPEIDLLILDPIINLIEGRKDSYNASHVRQSLARLTAMIQKHSISCLGILHLRKRCERESH